jgi:hypothetical protein
MNTETITDNGIEAAEPATTADSATGGQPVDNETPASAPVGEVIPDDTGDNVTAIDSHKLKVKAGKKAAKKNGKVAAKSLPARTFAMGVTKQEDRTPPKQSPTSKVVAQAPASSALLARVQKSINKKITAPICACGCGNTTKGGKYRPGHDAKHHSALKKAAAEAAAAGTKKPAKTAVTKKQASKSK